MRFRTTAFAFVKGTPHTSRCARLGRCPAALKGFDRRLAITSGESRQVNDAD
jgi:hypothetical protein